MVHGQAEQLVHLVGDVERGGVPAHLLLDERDLVVAEVPPAQLCKRFALPLVSVRSLEFEAGDKHVDIEVEVEGHADMGTSDLEVHVPSGSQVEIEGVNVEIEVTGDDEVSRLAQSFNHMVARLDELDRMKSDFISQVSHDLKTPLVAMRETNAVLLEELPGKLNGQQKRMLALNQESSERLSSVVTKSWPSSPRARPCGRRCSPSDTVRRASPVGRSISGSNGGGRS